MTEDLTIETSTDGLRLAGELDAHSAPSLAKHLDPLPDGDGDVMVDIGAVEFIDSSGLRVIIDTHQRCEQAGRRLVLVNPQRAVVRLIEISGLTDYLHVSTPTELDG